MKKITLILLTLILTFSCKEKSQQKKVISENKPKKEKVLPKKKEISKTKTNPLKFEQFKSEENDELNKLSIDFENFKLIIKNYSSLNNLILIQNDTIILDEELGFNFENKNLEIQPKNKSDKFELSVAFENNLTVYLGEKQFQDLDNWKNIEHYQTLKDSSNLYFRTPKYNIKIKEERLEKDFEEIKKSVLKLKGEYITDEIRNVNSIKELPIEFWVSRFFLKIVRTDKTGKKENFILINNSSWGC